MKDIELPPLPDADVTNNTNLLGYRYRYSAIAMQAYARAAVEADRAQRVPDGFRMVSVEMLTRWRDAFAEELGAWDIDPPIHHVQVGFDETSAMLASTPAPAQQERKPMTPDGLADECETWLQAGGASNIVDAFEAGFRLAERHHGIKE